MTPIVETVYCSPGQSKERDLYSNIALYSNQDISVEKNTGIIKRLSWHLSQEDSEQLVKESQFLAQPKTPLIWISKKRLDYTPKRYLASNVQHSALETCSSQLSLLKLKTEHSRCFQSIVFLSVILSMANTWRLSSWKMWSFTLILFVVLALLSRRNLSNLWKVFHGRFFWYIDVMPSAEVRYIRIWSSVIKGKFFSSISKIQTGVQQNQATCSNCNISSQ